jgi:CBS domain-containing protein
MTPIVRTIHRDALVSKVAGILNIERISGAPLVDNEGDMVGIITETDLNDLELIGGNPYVTKAWEVACSDVVTIPVSASLQEAARTILDTQVRNLIVTDGATPVGVLSVADLVRFVERQDGRVF